MTLVPQLPKIRLMPKINPGKIIQIFRSQRAGFTIIEILIAISIIAILASIGGIAFNNALEKGSDARRKQDLKTVRTALLDYYLDNQAYPPAAGLGIEAEYASTGGDTPWIPDLTSQYLNELPKDPKQSAGLPTQLALGIINKFSKAKSEGQVAATTSLNIRVDASNDDAEEVYGPGTMNLTSPDLDLGQVSGQYIISGMRFRNTGIPQGATITNAYIVFTADESGSTGTTLHFKAEDHNDAVSFGSNDHNITNRSFTSATVDWNNVPSWNIGNTYNTPNLSPILQEIVNRPGWASDDLVIISWGTGKRAADSYDGSPGNAPLLHIDYSTGGGGAPTEVTSLTLINADTNADIGTMTDGMTIDFAAIGTTNLSVRANTNPNPTGSVKFSYDGNNNYHTENFAPYAIAGDSGGSYNPWTPTLGSHTLTATPYTGSGATGTAGTALTVNFDVVNGVPTPPPPSPSPSPPPPGATCAGVSNAYCYIASSDRQSFTLWAQLENPNDPEAIGQPESACNSTPPDGDMNYNFCLEATE